MALLIGAIRRELPAPHQARCAITHLVSHLKHLLRGTATADVPPALWASSGVCRSLTLEPFDTSIRVLLKKAGQRKPMVTKSVTHNHAW